ncbi:MAG: ribonuclease P protein component [Lewinellaceae bacterium]|jgi:ribonuclease P protein component|nr:ribonuclease P protein component [Lewinellaceae bacterium]
MPGFSRQERLKSRKVIARLFREGHSFMAYPFRVVWVNPTPGPSPDGRGDALPGAVRDGSPLPSGEGPGVGSCTQLAISVPKRHFRTAVQRNRLKRRIREAYRLHKAGLYETLSGGPVSLMLMYIAKEELPYRDIEAGMIKMIRKFPVSGHINP